MIPPAWHASNDVDGWRHVGGDEWLWLHAPTFRSVTVDYHPTGREPGWWVWCRVHDEHGNPTEGTHLVYPTKEGAWAMARGIRRAIEAEARVVPFPTQLTLAGTE